MSAPHKPPSKLYVLAAIVIAVVIWMVMGAPGPEAMSTPLALARPVGSQ